MNADLILFGIFPALFGAVYGFRTKKDPVDERKGVVFAGVGLICLDYLFRKLLSSFGQCFSEETINIIDMLLLKSYGCFLGEGALIAIFYMAIGMSVAIQIRIFAKKHT